MNTHYFNFQITHEHPLDNFSAREFTGLLCPGLGYGKDWVGCPTDARLLIDPEVNREYSGLWREALGLPPTEAPPVTESTTEVWGPTGASMATRGSTWMVLSASVLALLGRQRC